MSDGKGVRIFLASPKSWSPGRDFRRVRYRSVIHNLLPLCAMAFFVSALQGCSFFHPKPTNMESLEVRSPRVPSLPLPNVIEVQTGIASYYGGGEGFHGRQTANGEKFSRYFYTAAHRTLPFGTIVRVTNLDNMQTTRVLINDRGPFKRGRIIDLSFIAAKSLGMLESGLAKVRVEVFSRSDSFLLDKTTGVLYFKRSAPVPRGTGDTAK